MNFRCVMTLIDINETLIEHLLHFSKFRFRICVYSDSLKKLLKFNTEQDLSLHNAKFIDLYIFSNEYYNLMLYRDIRNGIQ